MSSTTATKIDPHLYYLEQFGDLWDQSWWPDHDGWRRAPMGCPFCGNGNFFFRPRDGAFGCISCGEVGLNIIDFHSKLHNVSPKKAARMLRQKWGVWP